jgi:hypothetical protein
MLLSRISHVQHPAQQKYQCRQKILKYLWCMSINQSTCTSENAVKNKKRRDMIPGQDGIFLGSWATSPAWRPHGDATLAARRQMSGTLSKTTIFVFFRVVDPDCLHSGSGSSSGMLNSIRIRIRIQIHKVSLNPHRHQSGSGSSM